MTIDFVALLQREFPYKVVFRRYGPFSDAVDYIREILGDCAYCRIVGGEITQRNPGATWDMVDNYLLFKNEAFAIEIKLRYG